MFGNTARFRSPGAIWEPVAEHNQQLAAAKAGNFVGRTGIFSSAMNFFIGNVQQGRHGKSRLIYTMIVLYLQGQNYSARL
jgi:hypothetical protein